MKQPNSDRGSGKLSVERLRILRKLAGGLCIVYSRDGDCGWISGESAHLADADIWAIRNAGFINPESDEREDNYGCDIITPAGRAAIASHTKEG